MATVLVIDDDPAVLEVIERFLAHEGYRVRAVSNAAGGLSALADEPIDVVLLDLRLPDQDGLQVLEAMRARGDGQPVIMMSGVASVAHAVRAVQLGAADFVEKPLQIERVAVSLRNALRTDLLARQNAALADAAGLTRELLGSSPAMERLRELVRKAAPTDARVLITGENGTGKELVARALHRGSPRADGPFVSVNCAAIPLTLIEAELLGFVKGAFTGATRARRGRFEEADGGTLFLDEVGDMPSDMQVKILRVLQESEVRRIGGSENILVDVRVLAATNQDVPGLVAQKVFREDLFFRLSVVQISTPPLRDRPEDVPVLVDHFLGEASLREGRSKLRMSPGALAELQRYDYPGNVRELQNIVERLVIFSEGQTVEAADLARALPGHDVRAAAPVYRLGASFKALSDDAHRVILLEALTRHDFNMAETARALQMDRSHLYRKCRGLGIRKVVDD